MGKETLDRAMENLKKKNVEETSMRPRNHCFGKYNDDQPSLFAVQMPFCLTEPNGRVNVELDVAFDYLDGYLTFSFGLSFLVAMST